MYLSFMLYDCCIIDHNCKVTHNYMDVWMCVCVSNAVVLNNMYNSHIKKCKNILWGYKYITSTWNVQYILHVDIYSYTS